MRAISLHLPCMRCMQSSYPLGSCCMKSPCISRACPPLPHSVPLLLLQARTCHQHVSCYSSRRVARFAHSGVQPPADSALLATAAPHYLPVTLPLASYTCHSLSLQLTYKPSLAWSQGKSYAWASQNVTLDANGDGPVANCYRSKASDSSHLTSPPLAASHLSAAITLMYAISLSLPAGAPFHRQRFLRWPQARAAGARVWHRQHRLPARRCEKLP